MPPENIIKLRNQEKEQVTLIQFGKTKKKYNVFFLELSYDLSDY